jgi:hypothetical protein
MRLYIATMDAVLVEFDEDGRIKLESEEWTVPSLQERRAIAHAAEQEIASLTELVEILNRP